MPLVVVPTPIGNLGDITLRAIEALRDCDIVLCEDTRRTLCLLNHLGIKKRLVSYHRHNELQKLDKILGLLLAGQNLALVSDAGTPCISDPGIELVRACIEKAIEAHILPGANAILPALIMSGFDASSFTFAGFLDVKIKNKKAALEKLSMCEQTLIFYISPHRAGKDMAAIADILGDRRACLVREISKVHEQAVRMTLSELIICEKEEGFRGELVLIVEGRAPDKHQEDESKKQAWQEEAKYLLECGKNTKDITALILQSHNVKKNEVKEFLYSCVS